MKLNQKLQKVLSFLLVFTFILGMTAVAAPEAKAAPIATGDTTITFVETTDIHGHLVETPSTDRSQFQYRMAYIAKQFNDLRAKGDLVVLNGGDTFQGTPLSNLTYGKYLIQTLDAMQYDASAVGNHEFDWGIEKVTTTNATLEGSSIPMLACNIFEKSTGKHVDFAKDYTIVERSGKKIAIIGWADEYSIDIMASRIASYEISEDASIVNKLAKELKDSKKADVVVVLAHDDAAEAAEKFDGSVIDALFGGHSHTIKNGVAKTGITYTQGYKEARGYSKLVLTIKADGRVIAGTPEFVDIYGTDPNQFLYSDTTKGNFDADVYGISNLAIAEVSPLLSAKLAVLPVDLKREMIKGSLTSVMGNWICDTLRDSMDVDFAFVNDGGIRCDFEAKTLTKNDIYTVSPFNNLMYKVEMTGAQIYKLLEQIVGNKSSNMQMSGLTAKYDLSLPEDSQVFDVRLADGTAIDLKKTYTLATNQYIATGGNDYSVFTTDVISSVNTNYVDNELLIEKVAELGKQGDLKVDTAARFTEGKKPASKPAVISKKTLKKGSRYALKVKNADNAKITYTSKNKKVAAVSKKGSIKAVKAGTTKIVVKVVQNGKTYKFTTTVKVK